MNQVYQWVYWYEELARNIANNSPEYLVDRAKRVEWFSPNYRWTDVPLFKYGDVNVDPFSFIYTLASKRETRAFQSVYQDITDVFELTQKLDFEQSEECFIFPTPSPINTLFHSGIQSETKPRLLRELFDAVVKKQATNQESLFNSALSVKGVGITNLTQALFLISPSELFPTDNKFREIFRGRYQLPSKPPGFDWSIYQGIVSDIKKAFECEFFEVNLWMYLISSKHLVQDTSSIFQLTIRESNNSIWSEWCRESYVQINVPNNEFERINRGDVVLVRQGTRRNKGIGIVLRIDDKKATNNEKIAHVVWMNKKETFSDKEYTASAFSQEKEVEEIFRTEDAYKLNFEILDKFISPPSRTVEPDIEQNTSVTTQYPLNQIFFGPPGTGKTYSAEERAVEIIDRVQHDALVMRDRYKELRDNERIEFVTFHQNYAYEDFIEGIRPRLDSPADGTNIEYELRDGLFKRLCNKARGDRNRAYVLIIDEINRGNISKIFGELITLIEDSRRSGSEHETQVMLPSSFTRFDVPNNVFIIGTMNTADRSIQLLDTALRRRFQFEELMPDPTHSRLSNDIDGINLSALLTTMNERIAALLDREHQIGHTYFFDLTSVAELESCFKFKVFPLLQEYFFDDWAKIRIVLGNNDFIRVRDIRTLKLGEELEEQGETVYERISLNNDVWTEPDQYRKIYE